MAPPVWTGIFAYFVSPAVPAIVPGVAFFGVAVIFFMTLLFATRVHAPTAATATG